MTLDEEFSKKMDHAFKMRLIEIRLQYPPEEIVKDFKPVGCRLNFDTHRTENVFRHKGDDILWEKALAEHRDQELAKLDKETLDDYLKWEKRYKEGLKHRDQEYLFANSTGFPQYWPVVIHLGWRGINSVYAYCEEDGSTTYHSPILPTKMDAIDWLVENIGLYGGEVHEVIYDPHRGIDGMNIDGMTENFMATNEWLVLSHPEYDRHTGSLPKSFHCTRTPEEKAEVRKALIERYGGVDQ